MQDLNKKIISLKKLCVKMFPNMVKSWVRGHWTINQTGTQRLYGPNFSTNNQSSGGFTMFIIIGMFINLLSILL